MNKQLYKEGDVVGEGDKALECVMVQSREVRDLNGAPTGELENHVYCFRSVADMERERKETSNPEPNNEEEEKSND